MDSQFLFFCVCGVSQLIQCVEIDGQLVWWYDSSVECYQQWQIIAMLVVAVFVPLPLVSSGPSCFVCVWICVRVYL